MRANQVITVVVADDSFLVLEAIRSLLAEEPGVEVVEACSDPHTARAAIDAHDPDALVTDIRMPPNGEDEGIVLANELRNSHPELGVVVLSQYSDPRYSLELLADGSDRRAYLLKDRVHDRNQLLGAIRAVVRGDSVVDAKVVDRLIRARGRAEHSPVAQLTPREQQILAEIAQGKSNAAIAEALHLTKRAVEKHIHAIFMKLGFSDAADISRRVKATLLYLADEPADG